MNSAVYGKTMKILRNRIDVRLVGYKKWYFKWTSKPSYMSQKIFENYLVTIHENKVALTPNKQAYAKMCISDFSKVLMYKCHEDYIKNKYDNNSILLVTDINSFSNLSNY